MAARPPSPPDPARSGTGQSCCPESSQFLNKRCRVHGYKCSIKLGCPRERYDMSNPRSAGFVFLVALAILLFASPAGVAQQPDAAAAQQAKQEKVTALKQSLAQNQAALKSYSWT